MGKIIEVYPCAGKTPHTAPVWQYDYGQTLHINGIDLPASYKAEFSNTTRGDAIATVQTTDEITIPAQYLESGAAVYIWLVVVDEQSRTTEYALIVPVAARAKPTDLEPSPQEQSEIDQTIAALNSGVSRVEQIADAIPDTINDALAEAKASGEFDGADGKDGKDGKDGADGQTGPVGKDGAPGTPGADGTTFTPSVSAEGVISWTNDGGKPNPQPMNIKGTPGNDGTSPTISVADITGGHRVTVTDANGTRSFDVMDGDDYTLTAADKADIAQQAADEVDVPTIATTAHVKAGTDSEHFLAPSVQDNAVFYALAKLAGADMASLSGETVGVYSEAQKVAIQKMLGIYEAPWELIREDTVTNAIEADIDITVDGNGQAFELTDAIIQLIMDDANTPSAMGGSGDIRFIYGAGSSDNKRFFVGAMNHSAGANAIATMVRVTTTGGLLCGDFSLPANVSGSSQLRTQLYQNLSGNRQMVELIDQPIFFNQIIVKAITGPVKYKLYGKRKWQ